MSLVRSRGNKVTWLAVLELLKRHKIRGWRRVGQFLRLRRLPETTQAELRNMLDLNECQTRRVVRATASMSN